MKTKTKTEKLEDFYYGFFDEHRNLFEKVNFNGRALTTAYDELHGKPHIEGVYAIDYISEHGTITAYVGESRHVLLRALQHMKVWFGNGYLDYWSGLTDDDLKRGGINIRLLECQPDPQKRLKSERDYISKLDPYLQQQSPNYHKYPYRNGRRTPIDYCIYPFHQQRRRAFLERLAAIEQ